MGFLAVVTYWYYLIISWGPFVMWGILGPSMVVRTWFWPRKSAEPKPKAREPKPPNILIEYLKAKKRKVCPIIEWT